MNIMANALLKAGLVDKKSVQKEERRQEIERLKAIKKKKNAKKFRAELKRAKMTMEAALAFGILTREELAEIQANAAEGAMRLMGARSDRQTKDKDQSQPSPTESSEGTRAGKRPHRGA